MICGVCDVECESHGYGDTECPECHTMFYSLGVCSSHWQTDVGDLCLYCGEIVNEEDKP